MSLTTMLWSVSCVSVLGITNVSLVYLSTSSVLEFSDF